MIKHYIISLLILGSLSNHYFAQTSLYSDVFYGGATGVGFSTGAGSGTINSVINIPFGSIVKKAFLIASSDSTPPPTTVTLNGINYTFNNTHIVTEGFTSFINPPLITANSSIRVMDISNDIDSSVLNYDLFIPPQIINLSRYSHFYLLIIFENSNLSKIAFDVFLNKQNVNLISNYSLNSSLIINNNFPVGLGLLCSHFCDTVQDGSYISVNGNTIGLIGGNDANSNFICAGTYANFAHYNEALIGLDDDTPDNIMGGPDALANIKDYLIDNSTVNLTFTYQSNFEPYTNPIRSIFLTYTTPCDTFSTTLTENVSICKGDTAFLAASGGIAYEWLPQVGLSCYNCPNPYYTDTLGRVYTCRIWNTDSCSKVLPVKINILPLPIMPSIAVNPTLCSGNTGHIHITNQPAAYTYRLDNGTPQPTLHFNNLSAGNHLLTIQAANGCSIDTLLTVAEVNNVVAQFTASPTSGDVPLAVNFTNQSANATNYSWYIENDTLNTTQANHTFDTSGIFTVRLVAYNTYPQCSDTAQVTIVAEYPFTIIAPSLYVSDENYTPYQIYTSGVKELHYELFTDQGKLVYNKVLLPNAGPISLWNSTQLAKGIYLYRIWAVDNDGVEKIITGKVMVM